MLKNRDVFVKDPASYALPNDGVAKIVKPETDEQWDVARYELENFVCEGSYHEGLRRILESYLYNLDQLTQQAVWVHGFYGCGKSHLVRVLDFLWRDLRFPDGATARGIARLPNDIRDALAELSNAGRRYGGLWSAAGTLGAGPYEEPRAALLGLVLRSAGLPERIHAAKFDIWLRKEGMLDPIRMGLEERGTTYEDELGNLLVSTAIAEELLRVNPKLAPSPDQVLNLIRTEFPDSKVTTKVMVDMMKDVFQLKSANPNTFPCVLIVIDELQQYLGNSVEKADAVQEAVEAAVSNFGSRLLFVATGQSALQADHVLQKLQARFTTPVALEDKDTETVVRHVVLQKKPAAEPQVSHTLDQLRGEIDRHLGGTQIGAQSADAETLVADYPLLPTRLRFWQKVLRGLDRTGTTAELRTQLRLAHEAARRVSDKPLGFVPGGDFIFDLQKPVLLQNDVLPRDTNEAVTRLDDGTRRGELMSRICALLFLVAEVNPDVGLRADANTLADLLVEDLTSGSARLRQEVPCLLEELLDEGIIMRHGDEYRIQTPEGAEWDRDYRARMSAIRSNDTRISTERELRLRHGIEKLFNKGMKVPHGLSKTPRHLALDFGPNMPLVESKIPIWVQSGWDVRQSRFREKAHEAGTDSPIVFVFMPRQDDEDLREHIAAYLACQEVLETRPEPKEAMGKDARRNIEDREKHHDTAICDIISRIVSSTLVFQGGGTPVEADTLCQALDWAVQGSLIRLLPRFCDADSPKWAGVCEKARSGDTSALADVGHRSDASSHPVCEEVLSCIGSSHVRGSEVRRRLEEPPLGWPRDAVDAALVILTLSGHLSATYRSKAIGASELTGTTIQQAEFRVEKRVVSTEERLEIRKLLQNCGIDYRPGHETLAVSTLLDRMCRLAKDAGGDPPLPKWPSTRYIDDLLEMSGNELLAEVCENRARLEDDFRNWNDAALKVSSRRRDWDTFLQFLDHAHNLGQFHSLHENKEAIVEQRSLLADPNPAIPLLNTVTTALRAALKSARKEHLDARTKRIDELLEDPAWVRLAPDKQKEILARNGLGPLPVLSIEDDEGLLKELDETPFSSWTDKTAAVAERVSQALIDAAQAHESEVERLILPRTTIQNEEELDGYLEEARRGALSLIRRGKLVILP